MYAYYKTDRGKVRSVNEDAVGVFYNQANQLLAIVADGMGGHQAGEVASNLAIVVAKEQWENKPSIQNPAEAEEWIQMLVEEMNRKIYEYSLENTEYEGMGTTVVLTISLPETVTIAHVGDSRCYLYAENELKQVTEDHSLVNELIRTGQISEGDAELHPRKNVLLRALGTEPTTKIDIKTIHWHVNDHILLCSDGLTNKVNDTELASHLEQKDEIDSIMDELVTLANDRGGEDNITLAIITNETLTEVGDTSC